MELESGLRSIIEEYFRTSEYKVIDIIYRGERGTKVLEIFVDNRNGINIDDITGMNKDLSALIDEKLIVDDISNLVVSSPGAERPIKFIWQLEKHIERTLEAELHSGELVEGRLMSLYENEDDGRIGLEITIKEKGKKSKFITREIHFKEIKELKVKLSFSKK